MNRFEGVLSPADILLEQARRLNRSAIVAEGMGRYSDAERLRARAANKTALAEGKEVNKG